MFNLSIKIAFTLWSVVRSFNSNMPSIPAAKNANKEGKANLTYILEARGDFLKFYNME